MEEDKPAHKIGLFPGSFDPIHEGHLTIIELARAQLQLSKIYLLPLINPHKNQTDIKTRVETLNKRFQADNTIEILDYPKNRLLELH